MSNVVVANKYGEIIAGKVDDSDKGGDLFLWALMFWQLNGMWDNFTLEEICNRTHDIWVKMSKIGDWAARSKEQNRELFEVLANEWIKENIKEK